MQCPHCKSKWEVGNTKSQQQLENCPFCGESLATKKEEAPDTSTLGGVLRSLVLERGTDIYKAGNGHKLKAFLSDMAVAFPKERKTLNIAIQENIPSKLLGYDNKAEDERQIAMYDCVYQLEEDCGLSKERATEVVNSLAVGLGWSVELQQKPQQPTRPTASSAPVPQQANTPQNMVYVEGGTFLMGSSDGRRGDEKPVHEVTVSSFYMGKYEVTQEEYQAVMGRNPFNRGCKSVDIVTWYNAVEYCNRLSKKEGLTPCYSGSGDDITCNWNANGYRLPTEAEWEYAARGGINKDDYIYSGSNDIDEVAWYHGNSGGWTHNVGTKKANSLGIYDMSGNVLEWCWDWYDKAYYSKSPRNNPTGAASGSRRVYRGGCWNYIAFYASVSYRGDGDPYDRYGFLGFRVVRSC